MSTNIKSGNEPFPDQTLRAPGLLSDHSTWVFTDGDDVFFFPPPQSKGSVRVWHPDPDSCPKGVNFRAELKSFARYFFAMQGLCDSTPGPMDS